MDNIEMSDDTILIRSVEAKWPCLTKPNRRYNKYTLAIELDMGASKELSDRMDFVLQKYLERNKKSSEMQVAPNFEELDNGCGKFNLQNRKKPELLTTDGKPFVGEIGKGSTVNLAVDLIPYTNNAHRRIGVSIRVIGVEVIHAVNNRRSVREMFGHQPRQQTDNERKTGNDAMDW